MKGDMEKCEVEMLLIRWRIVKSLSMYHIESHHLFHVAFLGRHPVDQRLFATDEDQHWTNRGWTLSSASPAGCLRMHPLS